jgi:hypothetical protein
MATAKQARRPKKAVVEDAGETQRTAVPTSIGGRLVRAEGSLSDGAADMQDSASSGSKARKAKRIETSSGNLPRAPREQPVALPSPPTFTGLQWPRAKRGPTAATITVVACCSGIVGSLATLGLAKFLPPELATSDTTDSNLVHRVTRIDAELAALRASIAASAKTDAARGVERSGSPDQPGTKGANDATGPIPAAPAQQMSTAPLPTGSVVEGWVLRNVYGGSALVEGRPGLIQVMPGDSLPGVGRVETITREDGRWVVVTERGLIVAR